MINEFCLWLKVTNETYADVSMVISSLSDWPCLVHGLFFTFRAFWRGGVVSQFILKKFVHVEETVKFVSLTVDRCASLS